MKYIVCLLSVLIFTQLQAQNYDHELHQRQRKVAVQFYEDGRYSESLLHFDSAFMAVDFYTADYIDAFIAAYRASDMQRCEDYLRRGTLKGMNISDLIINELDSFLVTDRGIMFLSIKDSLLSHHFESIDMISYNLLIELEKIDQQDRDRSPEMFYRDSLNFEALIQLTKERGFPTFPTTGYGCNAAWLLLWHHRGEEYPNSAQWQRILPYIHARIASGLLDPNFLEMHDNFNPSDW